MPVPYSQSYLSQYAQAGAFRCACGREHRLGTRKILLGDGVIGQLPEHLRDWYGSSAKLWVLSDENTENAAGRSCKQLLSGFRVASTVVPASPRPRTTEEIIRRLSREAAGSSPDLILGIGGGTISDILKVVSLNLDVPNWCVATAPSVDAYSSGTSALKLKYSHKSAQARATELIVADLAVLGQAPEILFLSGVGDLLAKYLSYLDWRISALVTDEYICGQTARVCLDSGREALNAVKTINKQAAVASLTDAVLLSGLAMQALASSRPASSAEHTLAHFWEIAGSVENPEVELHGLLVGLSCRILLGGYRGLYQDSEIWEFDLEDRLATLAAEAPWEQTLTAEIRPFYEHMREEMGGQAISTEDYRGRLQNIQKHQRTLIDLAGGLLTEVEEAVGILADISFPFSLSEYKLDPRQALLPLRYLRFLRNRYSTFNLIHEIGAEAGVLGLLEQETLKIR